MPSFAARSHADEWMDDLSVTDDHLKRALDDLQQVNRWLGGHAATLHALKPVLQQRAEPLRVLDLATGVADFPAFLVGWAARQGISVEVVAVDLNPTTVSYARQRLDRDLPPELRSCIRVVQGDVQALAYADGAFDVCTAALFMHHLDHGGAVRLVREMRRLGRRGLVVNDLHRHPLAYYGFKLITTLLPVSLMVRHDGLISVLRAFTKTELRTIAEEAGLDDYHIRWHWAFRWTLSTVGM